MPNFFEVSSVEGIVNVKPCDAAIFSLDRAYFWPAGTVAFLVAFVLYQVVDGHDMHMVWITTLV